MSTNKSVLKSAGIIGVATCLSRMLGFVRDILIARLFGTTIYAQAFVVAFRIPNLLRDLIGEGATNAAFVPVLTEELTKKGRKEFFRLAQAVLKILLLVLLVTTILGMLASPVIVRLIAPGFSIDKEKFQLTVALTRFLFPFLVLIGLWAYAMGVLNSLGHFAAPSLGSSVLNFSVILCAVWFSGNVFGLAAGVLIGGLLQLLVQLPPLYINGWRFRLKDDNKDLARGEGVFRHPRVKKIGILLIPRALGACVYQVNIFVSTVLASLSTIVGDGAVAALYYANRIWQLPLAIFGIALAQAALPTMSKQVVLNDIPKLKDTLLFSLRTLVFILVPSTVGLVVLNTPITKALFERGAFTEYSTQITSDALLFYALGLIACGAIKVLVSVFYSMQDTLTPVKIAGASLVVNILLNLLLMRPLKVGGLALATSTAAVFNCILLYHALRRKIGSLGVNRILDSILKVLLASLAMGLFCYFVSLRVNIIVCILLSIIVYFLFCFLLGCREIKEVFVWILWILKKK